jgi:transposase
VRRAQRCETSSKRSAPTDRHRLNRGGNRQLNRVIHFVALTQVSRSPEGRRYYLQKQQEGKTAQEALRCLKRRVSDRIFKTLRAAERLAPLT